jgi:dTDP-glucose pyrophosphorylase
MLNILLLLAGQSAFFNKEEYVFPKPLIEINGKSMIQHVIENLDTIQTQKRYICVVNNEDCKKYHLDDMLTLLTHRNCEIVYVDGDTQGAVCSALMAIDHIDPENPLIIANPDQIIESDLNKILHHFQEHNADAGVACFETVHPRWSYVRLENGLNITEAAEKRTISKHAIAGFYYFARGEEFIRSAMKSIQKASSLNGVYYVSLVLNELVLDGKQLIAYHLDGSRYHTFYSPQKIEEYQKLIAQNKAPPSGQPITVLIPMAGQGKRFEQAGYHLPKPFIDVGGKPMIARVIENLFIPNARYVLIARSEHIRQNPEIVKALSKEYPIDWVEIDQLTEGTACTLLQARQYINDQAPFLIANCDQIIDGDINLFVEDCLNRRLDGSILTFIDPHADPKWSFAKIDARGLVTEVQEKKPISEYATVGIYFFTRGRDFINSAIDMIARNERVNNEFYTCPTYNYAIRNGLKIGIYMIEHSAMHGIGTPEDLKHYLAETLATT